MFSIQGFRTRGTVISNRLLSLRRLLDDTGRDEQDAVIPYQLTSDGHDVIHIKQKAKNQIRNESRTIAVKTDNDKSNAVRYEDSSDSTDSDKSYFCSTYPSEGRY